MEQNQLGCFRCEMNSSLVAIECASLLSTEKQPKILNSNIENFIAFATLFRLTCFVLEINQRKFAFFTF